MTSSTQVPGPGTVARGPAGAGAPAIAVRGLTKKYGDVVAVDGVDLTVLPGEVFAVLGPNGAGKTTTLEVLEGYRHRDGGSVSVLGVDPERAGLPWRARIGLVLQASRLPAELTVTELVRRYAGYYPHPRDVDETVELVGLADKRTARAGSLSGGQQRRLDVAIALVGDPDLVFLDEPTTGFDPAARRMAWSMVDDLKGLGKTVLLTTHYMDEAEALADHLAVIVAGRVVARGTPETIGGRDTAPARISLHTRAADAPAVLAGFGDLVRDGDRLTVVSPDVLRTVGGLVDWARSTGDPLTGLEVRRPSLEDVYLELAARSGS